MHEVLGSCEVEVKCSICLFLSLYFIVICPSGTLLFLCYDLQQVWELLHVVLVHHGVGVGDLPHVVVVSLQVLGQAWGAGGLQVAAP